MGSITATISESTFSGSKSVNRGGAIYAELNYDAALTIENTQFESSNSNSDGGLIKLKTGASVQAPRNNNKLKKRLRIIFFIFFLLIEFGRFY
jgi:predicted outer membrane repeat protein